MPTDLAPIRLPYGGGAHFYPLDLVYHLHRLGRNYIVQGQQIAPVSGHTKPQSLDYWQGQYARNPDTKQADNQVLAALVATGLFRVVANLRCPDTGHPCKGLELIDSQAHRVRSGAEST